MASHLGSFFVNKGKAFLFEYFKFTLNGHGLVAVLIMGFLVLLFSLKIYASAKINVWEFWDGKQI